MRHLCMNLGHVAGEFAKGGAIYRLILVMQTISLAGLYSSVFAKFVAILDLCWFNIAPKSQ
jgi:hypothetical protein